MLIEGFSAQAFATNCWVIASAPGQECVIIDPGMPDVSGEVDAIVAQHRLKPVATIITHGHLDHTFSIVPLCAGYGIPTYIHTEDRILLTHPERALSPEFATTFAGSVFDEPDEVRILRNGDDISLPGMTFKAIHAPGHTRGSLIFTLGQDYVITGDVLFKGSIGRTDLPGGSHKDMESTLAKKIWPLPDAMTVLPGHGSQTTIGHERATNPYLQNVGSAR